jgi:hypothetical protein
MPDFTLGALNAATEPVPIGTGTFTFDVSGTFSGTVQLQRQPRPDGAWQPVSLSVFGGTPANYTAPTGVIMGEGSALEPDARVRAVMTAYVSGAATVRIGR